nr:MAG: Ead/Ea22-like protein [Bacteriophage sp.]
MSKIDYQALRKAAELAMHDDWGYDVDVFNETVTPSVVLALLDEIKHMQDQALDDGCRIAELEEALRDKQALIPYECDTTNQQFESLAKSE